MTTDRPSEPMAEAGSPSGSRPHRKRGANSLPYLFFLALFFLAQAFSSSFRALCERGLGVERTILFGLGFLCLHSAWLAFDTTRLRERLLDLLAETMKALRGGTPPMSASQSTPRPPSPLPATSQQPSATSTGAKVDPMAIEILVKAMASANVDARQSARSHLVRLTGHDLGDDAESWAVWLAAQRRESAAQNPGDAK